MAGTHLAVPLDMPQDRQIAVLSGDIGQCYGQRCMSESELLLSEIYEGQDSKCTLSELRGSVRTVAPLTLSRVYNLPERWK